jgi:hypothetical protein
MEIRMSVPAVSSAASSPVAASQASYARAADGDYKAKNSLSVQIKDGDGDFKPVAAPSTAAAQSSSAVRSALPSLRQGG